MRKLCPFSFCSFCCFSVGRKFRPGGRKFRSPEVPALFFIRSFWLSLFRVSLWRGSGNLSRKFPRQFPGVRKFRPWSGSSGSRKIWLSRFRVFSLEGVRNFAPEVSPEISGDQKFWPLTPKVPASRGCNGQILGEAINSLLLPQEEAAHSHTLSPPLLQTCELDFSQSL